MSIPGGLRRHEFRKSSQWFALRRDHAELVIDEVPVYERFAKYCVPGWDKDYRRYVIGPMPEEQCSLTWRKGPQS